MFTGIVEELGTVVDVTPLGDAMRLTIEGPMVVTDAKLGESISVNGVCLTVTDVAGTAFCADVMLETLQRSSLGALESGSRVNLERAAALGDRLGGHLVQGHVDGVGSIVSRESTEHWDVVTISLPPPLLRYVVEKGSITVDGVSLTVTAVSEVAATDDGWFNVSLIPTTLDLTTLGRKSGGDVVNLEVDVLAKYVERLLAAPASALSSGDHHDHR